MLAVLGFITILLVLALIMSKKVSTLVALIFVPAITGFIAAFINAPNVIIQAAQAAAEKAGTAYVEPVITFGTRFTKALSILSADYMYGQGPEQHRCHRCHVHLCHPVFQYLLGCRCL